MMLRKSWLWGGAALVLGLALGWGLAGPGAVFGQNQVLPGVARSLQPSLSPSPVSDAKLKVFAQALALIEEQYAEPKTTKDLVYGAIQGTLGTLDPHSSFMTPEEFRELQIETKGQFGDNEFTMTQKWTLSADGKAMNVTQSIKSGMGDFEQKMVFDKQ